MATSTSTSKAGPSVTSSPSATGSVQEFKIRVPKTSKKKYHVMRFNATLNVDFAKWTHVKMERENNLKEFKGNDEDMPKFGAGSEFGRDAREEARRKKYGIKAKKYKAEDQPWIMKVGGKTGKKFKGIREGGVSQNASYYVFTHAADGAIEAYPLHEWYNFQPIQRYKHLSAEEAEEEYGRRNKVINYFSLMMRKRLRGDEGKEEGEEEEKKAKGGKGKDLTISEMDEWMESEDDSSDSDPEKEKDNDSDTNSKKKQKNKKAQAIKKKGKKEVKDEAFEESDDGDEEGREKDYISDSSESESDTESKARKEMKGVAEEDGLRKMLTSDEGSDEENENEEKKDSEKEEEVDPENEQRANKLTKKRKKDDANKESSTEFSSDSDTDPENSNKKAKKPKIEPKAEPSNSAASSSVKEESSSSRSCTPTPVIIKKIKIDPSNECGITEEAVRRYLSRKPMTTTELLTKFKSKKTGVSSDKLVDTMTHILKKINPLKQTIKGKMYLSIKPQ